VFIIVNSSSSDVECTTTSTNRVDPSIFHNPEFFTFIFSKSLRQHLSLGPTPWSCFCPCRMSCLGNQNNHLHVQTDILSPQPLVLDCIASLVVVADFYNWPMYANSLAHKAAYAQAASSTNVDANSPSSCFHLRLAHLAVYACVPPVYVNMADLLSTACPQLAPEKMLRQYANLCHNVAIHSCLWYLPVALVLGIVHELL
jgi:hypothetical protein